MISSRGVFKSVYLLGSRFLRNMTPNTSVLGAINWDLKILPILDEAWESEEK